MDKVTHYAYCDFPGYYKCGKNILWPVTKLLRLSDIGLFNK
jgi:hypothetical protein